ncbi:MAG: DUF2961 domain-containing protein [Chloroflexia bacterium]|nr:DUF2961 domain-containing protein [Chloroflexia bacterium]
MKEKFLNPVHALNLQFCANRTLVFKVMLLIPVLVMIINFEQVNGQEIYQMTNGVSSRWASPENWKAEKGKGGMVKDGRKGSSCFTLKGGKIQTIAEWEGTPGIVRRIWMTVYDRSPEALKGIYIEMYWDNSASAAVNVPIGDFFGHGLGEMAVFENDLFSSPEGRSFNCFVPMPFKKAMKINLRNSTSKDFEMIFYDVDFTVGDRLGKDAMYLYAFYNHQPITKLREDYELMPKVSGKGRFFGVNVSVAANKGDYLKTWWGEGEVKMFIDGDTDYPTLCGTGTEDYIGTGFGLGKYTNRYQGCTVADSKEYRYAFYRYHIPDPVWFNSDIRITIQQIGHTTSKNLMIELGKLGKPVYKTAEKPEEIDLNLDHKAIMFERSDDFSSCAFFYLTKASVKI